MQLENEPDHLVLLHLDSRRAQVYQAQILGSIYVNNNHTTKKQMELPIYISNIFHSQCQAKQCTDEFAQCLMQTVVRRR